MGLVKRFYEAVAEAREQAFLLFATPTMAMAEAAGDDELPRIELPGFVILCVCASAYKKNNKPSTYTYEVWEGRSKRRRVQKFATLEAATGYLCECYPQFIRQKGMLGRAYDLFATNK